jgi:Glycosyltransferase family 10 (fucosyltransferase) C-term/Alpha-(1,3)-fucosyltransferase FucT N-terminal domain
MQNFKPIRIATQGVAKDFSTSLFPAIVKSLGYDLIWSKPNLSDLIIVGPFWEQKKSFNWVPKPLRPILGNRNSLSDTDHSTEQGAPKLFITGENVRHDFYNRNYAISFDLGITDPNHFRMPYWMEMVDWSKEGVTGNQNPRYGRLLNIEKLMQPLGNDFLSRPQKVAIFASHLREPRRTLLEAVKKYIEVVQYGRSFDKNIKNHLQSGIVKYNELQKVAFNLCPENGMHPGYYTEKIPEAFMAGCLPITWVDANVEVDFNPNALINLAPMSRNNFAELTEILRSREILSSYAEQALILKRPTLEPLKLFIQEILRKSLS